MAFVEVAANTLDTGYDIDNSCRFDDAGSNNLLFQMGTPTDGKKHTISCWVKKSRIAGGSQNIFTAEQEEGSPNDGSQLYFGGGSNDYLTYTHTTGGTAYTLTSAAQFRDPSAWYHIVAHTDSTDGTAGDRMKMYVNGTRISSFSNTPSNFPEDGLPNMNMSGENHRLGNNELNDNSLSAPWDGYIAEFYFIDGQALTPSSFGETDDNGVWIPKDFAGTYGDNGIRLEFKGTGTSANASGIGADTSGNGNHMTVADLTSIDTCVDTPTNNFCTWNSVDYNGDTALAEGNTEGFASSADDYHQGARGSIAVSSGKWYWEVKAVEVGDTSNIVFAGIISADHSFRKDKEDELLVGTYGMRSSNGNSVISNGSALAYATYGAAFVDGDILNLALDMDNNRLYIGKGGSWADGSGNIDESSINSYLSLSTTPSAYMPMVIGYSTGAAIKYQANFGNAPHSISSGNADANGYGNFEYAVPSGFYALCTKNLAEYG